MWLYCVTSLRGGGFPSTYGLTDTEMENLLELIFQSKSESFSGCTYEVRRTNTITGNYEMIALIRKGFEGQINSIKYAQMRKPLFLV